jgi:hypothetical protein
MGSIVEQSSKDSELIKGSLPTLFSLLNSLCAKMPLDTPLTLHVEFSISQGAANKQIQVEHLTFGKK